MSTPHSPANTAGFVAFVIGTVATGISSVAGKVFAQTPDASITASHGIWATVALGVIGLLTQVVSGITNNARLRKEVTDKLMLAEGKASAAEARAERAEEGFRSRAKQAEEAADARAKRAEADARADADRAVADARAEAARMVADVKAEYDRQMAKAQMEAAAAHDRRKAEREFQNAQMLRMDDDLGELQRKAGLVVPRVKRNEEAIEALSAGTDIPVPPPPAP